jgi:predicted HTH transcriptional regulator
MRDRRSAGGGAVSVAMYDNHLEIINRDTLHFDITPEKLAQPHQSRPRGRGTNGCGNKAGHRQPAPS